MGLFNLFKKNSDQTPSAPSAAAPSSQPAPAAAPSPQPAPTIAPAPRTVPAEEAPPRPANDPVLQPAAGPASAPSGGEGAAKGQAPLPWPKLGGRASYFVMAYRFRVFVDASFLKSELFPRFVEIWREGKTGKNATRVFFIPSCEKEKLSEEEQRAVFSDCCREFFCKDSEDCFAQMKAKGLQWNVIWITNDGENASQARNAAQTNGIPLRWYGMREDGSICSVGVRTPKSAEPERSSAQQELFRATTEFSPVARTVDPPLCVPAAGGKVVASGSASVYQLLSPVMSDHVSITYKTNDPAFFAKIYTPQVLRVDMFERKTKRMTQTPVSIEGVCWPKDLLTDAGGSFVGILVPASGGVQLTRSVFAGSAGLQMYFPRWNKHDLVELAQTIISVICRLEDLGIRFGCFNPSCVYIESSTKVWFVDMDALQIEGYPVLSQNLTFTLPERVDLGKAPRLFNRDEDNYQIALLLFMLLMPGKYPYSKKQSNSEADSIRDMSFPFGVGELRRSQDAERPGSVWQIVWDHLPYSICSHFYNTFTKTGSHAGPGQRLSGAAWLPMLASFGKNLEKPENAESLPLFPRTFRRDGKRSFYRCSNCGQEHPDFYFLRRIRVQRESVDVWSKGYRICLPCAVDQSKDPDAKFTCQSCKKTFYYTNRTQIVHQIGKLDFDWKNQRWCSSCKRRTSPCKRCGKDTPIYQLREYEDKLRNQRISVCPSCFTAMIEGEKARKMQVYQRKKCVSCSAWFDVTVGEYEYFTGKGLNIPSRCPRCRRR